MLKPHGSRLGLAWTDIRDSLWFLPTLSVVAGAALAMLAVEVPTPRAESRLAWVWLFGGGADGARGVLSVIAGSLITVTGVVFSVTIVALQLASSQFTPRVLRGFVADRVNQAVLGVFIGTFTYTLLVLRTIHAAGAGGSEEAFVPHVGVTVALVLLLVSIGALIVFINHAARSVQAAVILHRESARTLERIEVLFPRRIGRPESATSDRDARDEPLTPDDPPGLVAAPVSGYLQMIDGAPLWRLEEGRSAGAPLTIRMELHIGAFAFAGKPIASVWPAQDVSDDVARAVHAAFVLGNERTPEQDVEYGIVALADIAVRALSPGINDPTTAMQCIDRLTEVLAALAMRDRPEPVRTSPGGWVRLVVRTTSFERALGVAFDQIRHYGGTNPSIAKKLLESIHDLVRVCPDERGPLAVQAESVLHAARRSVDDPADIEAIERLAMATLHAVRGDGPSAEARLVPDR